MAEENKKVACTCQQLMPVEGARSDGAAGKCEEEQGHNTGVKPVAVAMDTAIAALLSIFKGREKKKRARARGEVTAT
jgi:hypothetical protein